MIQIFKFMKLNHYTTTDNSWSMLPSLTDIYFIVPFTFIKFYPTIFIFFDS